MKLVILPKNPDDTVTLARHDFRRPGQPTPWRVKMTRAPGCQEADMLRQLGSLAAQQQQQAMGGQQQQGGSNLLYGTLGGMPFGGLGR